MKTKFTFFIICLFIISSAVKAQIGADKPVLVFNWSRIENTSPVNLFDKEVANGDTNKDGAVLLKGTANTPELQGIQCQLSGTPGYMEQIDVEVKYYQSEASYVKFKMQLFNATDNIVLTETQEITAKTQGVIGTAALAYTFKPSSLRDRIMVRFVRTDDLNPVRVLAIDCLKVNGKFVKIKK